MTKRRLDAIDEQLLRALSDEARLPAAVLARRLGLSRSAVQERLKRLERDGVITGYTVRLAEPAAPQAFAAIVMVTLDPKLHDRAVEALRNLREVRRCLTVSGVYDLVVEIAAASPEALDEVLTRIGKLPGIARTTSSVVLSTKFDRR